jgi:lysophospholipase L1-like esterase
MRFFFDFLTAIWAEHPALFLLSPIFLLDGLYARVFTARLPEAAGPRSGRAGSGPTLRLLIVGDSAAAGVGVDQQEQALAGQVVQALQGSFTVHWKIIAVTGATTQSTISDLESRPVESHDVALTSLGVNDVTSGVLLEDWLPQQARLLDLLRERFGVHLMLVTGFPPVHKFTALPQPLRWFMGRRSVRFHNALREFLAGRKDCEFIELFQADLPGMLAPDGFHPSAQTYSIWGKEAALRTMQHRSSAPRA